MNWIEMLRPILNEYKDGNLEEPLDGDGVDDLCRIIKAKINLHEGNLTNSEYEQILDGCDESNYIVEESKGDDLPDGLQKYIDGVALNILHRNYHKSTNGIWSKAEVDEEMGDEWIGQDEYYVVNIDFGCQDDTRNESYRESIDVWKDKKTGKWTISDKEKV